MADLNTIGGIHYEMMRRCYNPKSISWSTYGGIGIKVYEEWHNREVFKNWAYENGYKSGLRLQRKDATKDYCPENCYFGDTYKSRNNKELKEKRKTRKEKQISCGIYKNIKNTPIYSTYNAMKSRCYNKNKDNYSRYGGRGITICPEWLGEDGFINFYRWAIDNGWFKGASIDRIDNDNGYSPDNCRWVNITIQQNNRSCNQRYLYNGKMLTISEISKETGIKYQLLYSRIRQKNMSVYDAIKDIQGIT